ncbi:hypothetical protein EC3234A_141c00020 [Escherichia coli]|nr:hypothetical protein EC3234A_141c00020 [Escherichia coli]
MYHKGLAVRCDDHKIALFPRTAGTLQGKKTQGFGQRGKQQVRATVTGYRRQGGNPGTDGITEDAGHVCNAPALQGFFQQRQVALHPGFIPVPGAGRDAHDHDRINTVPVQQPFHGFILRAQGGKYGQKHQQRHFSAQLMETTGHQIDAESPGKLTGQRPEQFRESLRALWRQRHGQLPVPDIVNPDGLTVRLHVTVAVLEVQMRCQAGADIVLPQTSVRQDAIAGEQGLPRR